MCCRCYYLIERGVQADKSSAGFADNGLVGMFPLERRDRGDVYVKTGTLLGHSVFIVKVSPWFAANVERGDAQGGFIGVFDSQPGHTIALLNEEHYLSDIRTAAAGALAARALAPVSCRESLPCWAAARAIPPRAARISSPYRIGMRLDFQRPDCMIEAKSILSHRRSWVAPTRTECPLT